MWWRAAPSIEITSERLTLSTPRRADYQDWAQLREVSRAHLEPWEPAWPSDAHSRADWDRRRRVWIKSQRKGRSAVFLLRRIANKELVGGVTLTAIRTNADQTANLGYWMGSPFVGHGYMSEAVKAVCHWSSHHLGLTRIEAGTLPENIRSRSVLRRCGFQEIGYARDYLQIGGRLRDHVLFAYHHDLSGVGGRSS